MPSSKKLLMISPARERMPGEDFVFKLGFLNLPYLAAATPESWDVAIIDEDVTPVDFSAPADLVALTAQTPVAPRAYQIADAFRKRGVPVVMGGVHASTLPEEALEHVDTVILGEGEFIWPQLLEDFENGRLQQRYESDTTQDLAGIAPPRRDLLPLRHYLPLSLVETTRGCPHRCDFCGVSSFFGHRYRTRPPEEVLAELGSMFGGGFRHTFSRLLARTGLDLPYFIERRLIYFIDSNFAANRDHAMQIMRGMIPMNVKWWCHATVDIANDTEFLDMMRRSGCIAVNVGFESLDPEHLKTMHKSYAAGHDYVAAIQTFHNHDIGIMGTFVVGFDNEDRAIFRRIFDFAIENKLDWALTFIRTPYPGTRLFAELKEQGRLRTYDWTRYDTLNCVYEPIGMSVDELEQGLRALWKYTFSLSSIFRRILRGRRVHPMFYLGMNMQFFMMTRKWQPTIDPVLHPEKK